MNYSEEIKEVDGVLWSYCTLCGPTIICPTCKINMCGGTSKGCKECETSHRLYVSSNRQAPSFWEQVELELHGERESFFDEQITHLSLE